MSEDLPYCIRVARVTEAGITPLAEAHAETLQGAALAGRTLIADAREAGYDNVDLIATITTPTVTTTLETFEPGKEGPTTMHTWQDDPPRVRRPRWLLDSLGRALVRLGSRLLRGGRP